MLGRSSENKRFFINIYFLVDVGLYKLRHDMLKEFVARFTKHELKSETAARNLVQMIFDKTIEKIRKHIGVDKICFIMDETQDLRGRYVFTCIVVSLENPDARYTINVNDMENKKATSVLEFFLESMEILYPMENIDGKLFRIMT